MTLVVPRHIGVIHVVQQHYIWDHKEILAKFIKNLFKRIMHAQYRKFTKHGKSDKTKPPVVPSSKYNHYCHFGIFFFFFIK